MDISNGIGDGATYTDTDIVIYVPQNSEVEINSHAGSLYVTHPNNTLLINNNGLVEVDIKQGQGINLTASSMIGNILLDPRFSIVNAVANATKTSNDFVLLDTKSGSLQIDGGGAETSIMTLVNDIKVCRDSCQ